MEKWLLRLSVSQGKRSCEEAWLRGTGAEGNRLSWTGGSDETLLLLLSSWSWPPSWVLSLLSSDLALKAPPKPMQNPRSLLPIFGALSRNRNGFEASPKLRASSIFLGMFFCCVWTILGGKEGDEEFKKKPKWTSTIPIVLWEDYVYPIFLMWKHRDRHKTPSYFSPLFISIFFALWKE